MPPRRPGRRVGLTIASLGLAWAVSGWIVGPGDQGAPVPGAASPPAIRPTEVFGVIVADRPATATRAARGGELRSEPWLFEAVSGPIAPPHAPTGDGGFPASLITVQPLSFGFARRAPPARIGR